jgi:hypothetical protein
MVLSRILGCAFLFFAVGATLVAQTETTPSSQKLGAVRGIVLDENGNPVAGATVAVMGAISRTAPTAVTDAQGWFLLQGLRGEMGLHAYKPSDGYPYNFFAFFKNPGEIFPLVNVASGQVIENVVIRLGAKAAVINFDVRGADDDKPMPACLTFTRPDMPEIGSYGPSISPKESFLVPAVPLRLTVNECKTAATNPDKYEPWHYAGDDWQSDKGLILLKPGETLDLSIRLKRLPEPPTK